MKKARARRAFVVSLDQGSPRKGSLPHFLRLAPAELAAGISQQDPIHFNRRRAMLGFVKNRRQNMVDAGGGEWAASQGHHIGRANFPEMDVLSGHPNIPDAVYAAHTTGHSFSGMSAASHSASTSTLPRLACNSIWRTSPSILK